jgi:MGT family glycosyltransferase
MAKALFFNLPFYGHMNPTLPLVAELVQRGEQVIYYASETFRPAIEQAGATFRGIDACMTERTLVDDNLMRFAYTLIHATQALLPAILPEVQADPPDYMLYDSLCVWGKCVAQILQVPAIASVTTLARPHSLRHPEVLASFFRVMPTAIQMAATSRRERAQFRVISKHLQETYHIPRPQLANVYANLADLNLVYSTRQIQIYPHAFDARFKFVGPFLGARAEAPDFPFDGLGDQPVIYISLGTVFNDHPAFYRLCFDAFAGLPYQVVLSIGIRTDPLPLGTIPSNFIVKPFVPQLQLLQRAALFITHSGMNSVSEGLWAGVPLLMLPQAADQHSIAQRVQRLGAGKRLPPKHLTARRLRAAAEELLAEPRFQQRSAAIGASFRQAGGPAAAVDEIEAFKRRHGLDARG